MKRENGFLNNFIYPLIVGLILAWATFYFFSERNNSSNNNSNNRSSSLEEGVESDDTIIERNIETEGKTKESNNSPPKTSVDENEYSNKVEEKTEELGYSVSAQIVDVEGNGMSGIVVKCGNCQSFKKGISDSNGFFKINYSFENPNPISQVDLLFFRSDTLLFNQKFPLRQSNPPKIQIKK